jgi:ADP-heptose:LPS heptosyltransferase
MRASCVPRSRSVISEGTPHTRPQRVLLVRVDGIGDALALAPLVAALRDAGHELGAVLSTRNAGVYAPNVLARVHVLERIPWPRHGSTAASYARALDDARATRYDVALVASEEPEAYRFARAAGIPQRVGFANGWERPAKSLWSRRQLTKALHRPASAWHARAHEVETLFDLGAGLHGEPGPTRDTRRLAPLVVTGEPPTDGRIVLQVSAKYASLGFGVAEFGAIARRVASRHAVVVVSDGGEAELARAVHASAQRAGVALDVPATLDAWKGRLAGARAVVTLDSGAAHVAGMVGTPCVDIFVRGPHVDAEMRRWAPWAAPSQLLSVASPPQPSLDADVGDALDRVLASQPAVR